MHRSNYFVHGNSPFFAKIKNWTFAHGRWHCIFLKIHCTLSFLMEKLHGNCEKSTRAFCYFPPTQKILPTDLASRRKCFFLVKFTCLVCTVSETLALGVHFTDSTSVQVYWHLLQCHFPHLSDYYNFLIKKNPSVFTPSTLSPITPKKYILTAKSCTKGNLPNAMAICTSAKFHFSSHSCQSALIHASLFLTHLPFQPLPSSEAWSDRASFPVINAAAEGLIRWLDMEGSSVACNAQLPYHHQLPILKRQLKSRMSNPLHGRAEERDPRECMSDRLINGEKAL